MGCQDIHPLLAGYVDGELSPVERETVEDHVAACPECRALMDEQRAGAEVYAAYPVEDARAEDWAGMWTDLEGRLPARAKRVSLESLAGIDVGDEFLDEDKPSAADQALPLEPGAEPTDVTGQPAAPEAEPVRLKEPKRRRVRVFKPIHVPRVKHTFWAHVAGIAASILIVAMVLLSVKPVIRVEQLASNDQVEIDYVVTDPDNAPIIHMLQSDTGDQIPLIWVAHVTDDSQDREEGTIR